ncbi:MAG: hypothetical protein RQ729_13045 [Wenzhouxiangellaceae bacterium]|nr:hypothetical protein [Wenzhouxiangellaceae bacterium]
MTIHAPGDRNAACEMGHFPGGALGGLGTVLVSAWRTDITALIAAVAETGFSAELKASHHE